MENLRAMAERLRENKNQIKDLEEQVKILKADNDVLEEQISTMMLQAGQTRVTFSGIGTLSPVISRYPSIVDKESFYKYLRETNQEGMIQETVNSNTLRSWFTQKAFTNEESSKIGLDYYEKVKISLTSK